MIQEELAKIREAYDEEKMNLAGDLFFSLIIEELFGELLNIAPYDQLDQLSGLLTGEQPRNLSVANFPK